MMRNLIVLMLLCLSQNVVGQNYGQDILDLIKSLKGLESYEMSAKVSVKGVENYSFSAEVKSSADYGAYYKVDVTEMIMNSKYCIGIDHEEMTIQIQKGNFKEKDKSKGAFGMEQIEELSLDESKVKYLGKTENYKTYVLSSRGDIEKVIVKLDVHTGFFHEIETVYQSEDITISSYKVKYTSFNKNASLKKTLFEESNVFSIKNGEYVLNDKYKDYQIIQQ